ESPCWTTKPACAGSSHFDLAHGKPAQAGFVAQTGISMPVQLSGTLMPPPTDYSPLWLSLQVAFAAPLLILPPGILAAWWLARRPNAGRRGIIDTLLSLPLVLPPTVVGYYLLLVFGRGTAWGRWLNDVAKISLLFTWQGAAIAAAVMAFPL